MRNQLRRRYQELEGELNLSKDIPQIESALKVWAEIMKAFNAVDRTSLGWFRITKLNITQQLANLTVELDNDGKIDTLVDALATSEYLRGRAKNSSRPISKGTFSKNQQNGRYSGSIEILFGEDR